MPSMNRRLHALGSPGSGAPVKADASALVRRAPCPMALLDASGRLLAYSSAWLLNALSLPEDVASGKSGIAAGDLSPVQACLDEGAAQVVVIRSERSFRIDLCLDGSSAEPVIWATAADITTEQAALAVSMRRQRTLELALQVDETLVRESDLVTGTVEIYGISSDFIRDHALRPEKDGDWSWVDPRDKDAVVQELQASMAEGRAFRLNLPHEPR